MLKFSSIKDEFRKSFNNQITFDDLIFKKLNSFEQFQKTFNRTIYLIHFNKQRVLYINVNVFKEREFKVIIYHFKIDFKQSKFLSSKNKEIKSIIFMNKILSQTKQKY